MTQPQTQAPPVQEDSRIQAALDHLRAVLVPGESLQTYAVQRRIFALTSRRIVVGATSGRLIALTRNLFGGYQVSDVRWQDLKEVKLAVGMLGADVTVYVLDHADLAVNEQTAGTHHFPGLRKDEAQNLYRTCQAQQQAWREKRRIRELEELRARSGGLSVSGAVGGTAGGGAGMAGGGDPVERLKAAKEMLANGLITDSEFEAIKAKVVAGL